MNHLTEELSISEIEEAKRLGRRGQPKRLRGVRAVMASDPCEEAYELAFAFKAGGSELIAELEYE